MAKVSVIIPVYCVEDIIERCARSLFDQTLDDMEFIFIDDCSPDKSVDVLKNVLKEYPHRRNQVIIHSMTNNSGQAAVREWGIKNANAEYVIHCDSDDWLDIHMYKDMYELAVSENADLVICDYQIHGNSGFIKYRKGYNEGDIVSFINDVLHLNVSSSLWNKLFKRSCLMDIEEFPKGNIGEDLALVLQMIRSVQRISYIHKPYYYYWKSEKSITGCKQKDKIIKNFHDLCDNITLIERIWRGFCDNKTLALGLSYSKNHAKKLIYPFIDDKEIYELWVNSFPDIEKRVLVDKRASIKERVKALLILSGMHRLRFC